MSASRFFRINDQNPFTGWHMLAIVCAFFGVVIVVNLIMAFAATGTFPGLIVKNSYVASQKYNDVLEEARQQSIAGWSVEAGGDAGILALKFAAPAGISAGDLELSVIAGRPSTTRYDRPVEMKTDGDAFRSVEALPAGVWEVDIEASKAGVVVFRERKRVVLGGEGV